MSFAAATSAASAAESGRGRAVWSMEGGSGGGWSSAAAAADGP